MHIPRVTQMTYYSDGKRFRFMLDLSLPSDRDKLIRTVRWAMHNDVDINLRSASIEEAVEHAEQMSQANQ